MGLCLLAPAVSEASGFGLAKGRTKAIRTQIAQKLNQKRLFNVPRIKSSDVRIRTKRIKAPAGRRYIIGSQHHNVTWKVKTGIVAGKAKSYTPIVPNGGRHTRVGNLRILKMPRAALRLR